MTTLPCLRQVVLLTADLDAALAEARSAFALPSGVRDVDGMAALGFEHEVLAFDQTFLEICAPLTTDSPQGALLAKQGDSGFMIAMQVGDLDGLVDRAAELGMTPVMHEPYDGHMISQWHPRDLGTLAEIDLVEPADTWHFAPEIFQVGSTEVAQDVVSVDIAVDDPVEMAARWAAVVGGDAEGPTLRLAASTLRFVEVQDGPRGLRAVDLLAADPARGGEAVELCGVTFRLVEEAR